MRQFLCSLGVLALLGSLVLPSVSMAQANLAGHLVVEDNGQMFSAEGIRKAKDEFAHLMTKTGREATFATIAKLPDGDKAKWENVSKGSEAGKKTFWVDFAKTQAKGTKGVFVFICRSPGEVVVLADGEMRRKGFTTRHEDELRDILLKSFRESAKEKPETQQAARDKGLFAAAEYLEKHLPTASTDTKTGTKPSATKPVANHANDAGHEPAKSSGFGGMGTWLCIGLIALLGIWMVFGLIRSFSGGGAGGYGGGGYGGGGGGFGGFFPSLLGGLFGAAAGMWMYDHFFGGHSSQAFGDTGNAATGGEQLDNQGAGDYSGDTGSAGSYDNDVGGGGDAGGDWGGGGDFGGGGGGDWGGGGGDF